MSIDHDRLGPIDYLVVEFPNGLLTAGGFDALLDLAERGTLRILDVEFVRRDDDGTGTVVAPGELGTDSIDLSAWEGASSGLLDHDDITLIAESLAPGSVAVAVVYENVWALGVVDGWAAGGARLLFEGGLAADDVDRALAATEPG